MVIREQRLGFLLDVFRILHIIHHEEDISVAGIRRSTIGERDYPRTRIQRIAHVIIEAHNGIGLLVQVNELLVEGRTIDLRVQISDGGIERGARYDINLVVTNGLYPKPYLAMGHDRGFFPFHRHGHPSSYVEGQLISNSKPFCGLPPLEEEYLMIVLREPALARVYTEHCFHVPFT